MWATARWICIPSPSLAGWGLMPYISNFLAMSSSRTSDSAGLLPLQGERIYEPNKCGKNDNFTLRAPWRVQCFLRPQASLTERFAFKSVLSCSAPCWWKQVPVKSTYMCFWWKCTILLSKQSWFGKYRVCDRCFLSVSSWKSPNSAA